MELKTILVTTASLMALADATSSGAGLISASLPREEKIDLEQSVSTETGVEVTIGVPPQQSIISTRNKCVARLIECVKNCGPATHCHDYCACTLWPSSRDTCRACGKYLTQIPTAWNDACADVCLECVERPKDCASVYLLLRDNTDVESEHDTAIVGPPPQGLCSLNNCGLQLAKCLKNCGTGSHCHDDCTCALYPNPRALCRVHGMRS